MSNQTEVADPKTGEIMTATPLDMADASLAVQMTSAEIDQQIATAKKYPRSIKQAMSNVLDLATLDDEAAAECIYALPRGGKPVKGPSVRLAEIIGGQWQNARIASRVVHVDKFEKYIEAEGIFYDLENNVAWSSRVRRRISDKHGRLYNDDMIMVTGNAAAAIAKRNAIMTGVPKAIWRKAYEAAEHVIAGDIKTLAERREGAIAAFAAWGITPEQVFASLEVEGLDDVTREDVVTLTAMYKAIKSGEHTVEAYFPPLSDKADANKAAKGTAAKMKDIADDGKKTDKPKTGKKDGDDAKQTSKSGDKPAEDDAGSDGDGGSSDQEASDRDDEDGGEEETTSEADQEEGDTGDPAVTEDDLKKARLRGRSVAQKGMKRLPIPKDYADNEELADAYLAGFDEEAPPQADEGKAADFTEEQIQEARDRGVAAANKGMSRKAVPGEYRDKPALAEAWLEGHDNA